MGAPSRGSGPRLTEGRLVLADEQGAETERGGGPPVPVVWDHRCGDQRLCGCITLSSCGHT